ncbi:MAG: gas vesicle protein [Desulfobaccales bacterium]
MGLLLICPHCSTKLSLACRTCPGCGADLGNLPATARRYFIGEPEDTPLLAPELIPEPSPETVEPEALETYMEISENIEPAVVEPHPKEMLPDSPSLASKDVSLCEALDRVLNKGAVLFGEVMISVADIDLVYLGLQVILSSMETARDLKPASGATQAGPNIFAKGVY